MGASSLCPLWSLYYGLILRQSVTDETVACPRVLFSTVSSTGRQIRTWPGEWGQASVLLRFRDPLLGSGPSPIQIIILSSSPSLFFNSAILNPFGLHGSWRLHQEANWAFIKSDFWEIAARQGPGCKIIFNDVHLITRKVFVSSLCNSV